VAFQLNIQLLHGFYVAFTIIFAYGNGNEIKIKVVGVAGSGRQGIEIWGFRLKFSLKPIH